MNGEAASWSRTDHELMVVPAEPLAAGAAFTVVVRYQGIPRPFRLPGLGPAGFIPTRDGAIVAGEPEIGGLVVPGERSPGRSRHVHVPRHGADGPQGRRQRCAGEQEHVRREWTTHVWQAHDPMVSYLATIDIGDFRLRFDETESGLPVIDAVDPDIGGVADAALARQPRILSFLEERPRALSVRVGRGHRPRHRQARVRPRDADATDLLDVLLPGRRPSSSSTSWRTSGSAT